MFSRAGRLGCGVVDKVDCLSRSLLNFAQLKSLFDEHEVSCVSVNDSDDADRETNGTLISALAKAYRWQEQLESGEYASLDDLTTANGVDRTYVGRILRLTSLAPAIIVSVRIHLPQCGHGPPGTRIPS